MDNMGMDPELASETVKLFAQELKIVRAQLREAEKVGSSTISLSSNSPSLSSREPPQHRARVALRTT